jgi:multicomponent Na+:H+ antiporter subunit B
VNPEAVTRCFGTILVPFVLVFGLYVVWHGEAGPGGGFQGGVIIATAFVLYGLLHGMPALRRVLSRRLTLILTSVGVLLYAGVGVACVAAGGRFLEYSALTPAHPTTGQVVGITLVEFGVGLAVFSVMLTIFDELSGD